MLTKKEYILEYIEEVLDKIDELLDYDIQITDGKTTKRYIFRFDFKV